MTKQVSEFTDIELKAIAYETVIALEQNKANLQAIQQELQRRAELAPVQEPSTPEPKTEKEGSAIVKSIAAKNRR